MKSQWIIHKLTPLRISSLIPSLQTPYPNTLSKHTLNHLHISHILSICGTENYSHLGYSIHASIIKNPEFTHPNSIETHRNAIIIWNSLLSFYTKRKDLNNAVKLFDEMPIKDTVSWNAMISGFMKHRKIETGFGLFKQMLESGSGSGCFRCCCCYGLDQATFTTVLSVCDGNEFCNVNKMIHGLVFLSGYDSEITVGNALITSYFKCGSSSSGRRVFDEMVERNVISWTAVISGLAQNQLYDDGLGLFVKMRNGSGVDPNALTYLSSLMACSGLKAVKVGRGIHGLAWKLGIQSDICIESALMDMYSKCGSVKDAWRIFEFAEDLDEISMTVILVGFAQNGFEEEAIRFFMNMMKAGIELDVNMVSAVLGVFGVIDTSLGLGKQLHSLVIKRRFSSNPFIGNGLINMYSKCGDLEESINVFNRMPNRNSVSWNSMIAAFARHGDAWTAFQLYETMKLENVKPTDVTFLSLLHACSHVGLINKGMEFIKTMTETHGITPRTEHYACVVDMLGRAGLINEANRYIEGLPTKPDVLVWQALLGACGIHGDVEIGKHAAEKLILASPENPAPYVLMANIYSSKGIWKERARTIKRMKEMRVSKETGVSWIEIEKKVHSFVVEDRMHGDVDTIYEVLGQLFLPMKDEGYVPNKRFILYYLDEDNGPIS